MKMNLHYILDDKNRVVPVDDTIEWAKWYEKATRDKTRVVKQETIGDAMVSTVFLGLDHAWSQGRSPVLWETMVFGGKFDQDQDRCSGTWEQAEAMHEQMVNKVKQSQGRA